MADKCERYALSWRLAWFAGMAALAAALFLPQVTHAQNYPSRPVRLILPFGAGGVADVTARLVTEKLGDKLGQHEGGEGRAGRGLEDDGATGGEGGADLPGGHHERVIPGCNLANDANRLAARDGGVARHKLARVGTVSVASGPGEEAQVIDGKGDIATEADELVGFARVLGFALGKFFGVGLDEVG